MQTYSIDTVLTSTVKNIEIEDLQLTIATLMRFVFFSRYYIHCLGMESQRNFSLYIILCNILYYNRHQRHVVSQFAHGAFSAVEQEIQTETLPKDSFSDG